MKALVTLSLLLIVLCLDTVESQARLFKRRAVCCNNSKIDCGCHGTCGKDGCVCEGESCHKETKPVAKTFWPFDGDKSVSVVPSDGQELNAYVAKKLPGYNRPNFTVGHTKLDIYQARGKQRVVWEVRHVSQWSYGLIRALVNKNLTNANQAGIILVGATVKDSDDVVQAVRGAGMWLGTLSATTGELTLVVYPTAPEPTPTPIPTPEPAPSPPTPEPAEPAGPTDSTDVSPPIPGAIVRSKQKSKAPVSYMENKRGKSGL